jgi:hypothetical protein
MAARLRSNHSDEIRAKIQTSQLVNVLEKHVFEGTELKKTQVSAAIALLRKTIPDLQSIEGGLDLHHYKHEEALKELE